MTDFEPKQGLKMSKVIDKSEVHYDIIQDIIDKVTQLSFRNNYGFPKDYRIVIDRDLNELALREKEFGFLDYFDVEVQECIIKKEGGGVKQCSAKITNELMEEDIVLEGYGAGEL